MIALKKVGVNIDESTPDSPVSSSFTGLSVELASETVLPQPTSIFKKIDVSILKGFINSILINFEQIDGLNVVQLELIHPSEDVVLVYDYQSQEIEVCQYFGDNYTDYKVKITAELGGIVFSKLAKIEIDFA